jgi:4'-phosphopantetheinyl transferase
LPPAARPAAFFRIWTRKEAYVKGIGKGLSMPLTAVDVRESPIAVRRAGGAPQPAWVCRDLDVAPGYAAAVAAEGDDWIVTRRRWDGAGRSPVENER